MGVHARTLKDGKTYWRPSLRVDGDLIWGPSFRTQKEAHEARERMKTQAENVPKTGSMTLAEAFEETALAVEDKGGSPVTAKGYRDRFKKWGEILDPDAYVHDVTPEDVRSFFRARRRKHLVTNGLPDDYRILSRVFSVAFNRLGIPEGKARDMNPVRKVERPKAAEPDRQFFTMEEVEDIAGRVRTSGKPAADFHADLILFLAITGIRAFELERMRAPDLHVQGDRGIVTVHGKGGRVRRVAVAAIDLPLVQRTMKRATVQPLIRHNGLSTIFSRWARELNLEGRLSARALRRSFATDLDHVASMRTVQAQMGHSNLNTTQRYLGVSDQTALDAAEQRAQRRRGG